RAPGASVGVSSAPRSRQLVRARPESISLLEPRAHGNWFALGQSQFPFSSLALTARAYGCGFGRGPQRWRAAVYNLATARASPRPNRRYPAAPWLARPASSGRVLPGCVQLLPAGARDRRRASSRGVRERDPRHAPRAIARRVLRAQLSTGLPHSSVGDRHRELDVLQQPLRDHDLVPRLALSL